MSCCQQNRAIKVLSLSLSLSLSSHPSLFLRSKLCKLRESRSASLPLPPPFSVSQLQEICPHPPLPNLSPAYRAPSGQTCSFLMLPQINSPPIRIWGLTLRLSTLLFLAWSVDSISWFRFSPATTLFEWLDIGTSFQNYMSDYEFLKMGQLKLSGKWLSMSST